MVRRWAGCAAELRRWAVAERAGRSRAMAEAPSGGAIWPVVAQQEGRGRRGKEWLTNRAHVMEERWG